MTWNPDSWPIAAKMNFPSTTPAGVPLTEAPASVWEDHIRQVVEVGYRWIDPIDDWLRLSDLSDERFAEFKKLVARYELGIPAISFGRRSPIDIERGEEHMAAMHRMIERGAELGASVLNVGFMQALTPAQQQALWFWLAPGHVDDPALRPLAIERIRELADHAQRNGMEISLEVYEDTFLGDGEQATAFLADVDHPATGINPDIGNIVRLHRPIPSYQSMFNAVLPRANFWHIKNYIRDEDPRTGAYFSAPAPLETGLIDYRSVIRQALALGYRGVFQTEHYGGDWLTVGVTNAAFIRRVLRGATDLIGSRS